MIKILLWVLLSMAVFFVTFFIFDLIKHKNKLESHSSWPKSSLIGFIAYFFDALGIGAFAPATAMLKFSKQIKDINIPGTLNVSCVIPTIIEAFIFIETVTVDPLTLVSIIMAAGIGGWVGAKVVTKLPEHKIQLGIGIALLVTAVLILAGKMHFLPTGGGTNIGLTHWKLAVALVGSFVIGTVAAIGIGFFAPCMAMLYLLGISPLVIFPIMMGSCAFVSPIASIKFIKEKAYNRKIALSMIAGGVIGVLIAIYIVESLPLKILQWLVIGIILYTSIVMLRASKRHKTSQTVNAQSAISDH